jgi:hypothetical protein
VALVKGIFDDGGNSYADVSDWLSRFPSGLGYDGAVLAEALGASPADGDLAAKADARLIAGSRWVDAQDWSTGYQRVRDGGAASAAPPLLSLPRDRWYVAAGSPYLREGTYLNTDPASVPWVILAAVVEVAEVLRVNDCLTAFDVRNPADVLREQDVTGHVDQKWAAPLADQHFATARQYLAGLTVPPGSVRRGFQW